MHQVILVTIDTLRADHVGSYGYGRAVSPVLDRLAAESTTLEWALSPISYTGPAHFSLMTSRYPSFHSVQFHNGRLPSTDCHDVTLAEILQRAGYATGAFVGASVLSRRNIHPMGKGFKTYDERMTHHESTRDVEYRRWAADTNAAALAWIRDHRSEPFFCWIHYMDVHGPYEAPQPYSEQFAGEVSGIKSLVLEAVPDGRSGGIPEYQLLNAVRAPDGRVLDYERNYNYYTARYDGGIRYVDSCLGALIEDLKILGLYDDLFLVVTSDHGEALGENDVFFFHSLTVSMDQIRVPVIMRFPHQSRHGHHPVYRPGWIPVQVSTIDIAPTILDFLARGGLRAQGISLLPLIRGQGIESLSRRVIFSETETQVSAIDSECQLLLGRGLPSPQQFPFFHPDAPSSNVMLNYRSGIRTLGSEDRRLRLEYLARDFSERGREAVSSCPTLPGQHEDEQKMLAHLRALGYVS
jgi:arylsulfatase